MAPQRGTSFRIFAKRIAFLSSGEHKQTIASFVLEDKQDKHALHYFIFFETVSARSQHILDSAFIMDKENYDARVTTAAGSDTVEYTWSADHAVRAKDFFGQSNRTKLTFVKQENNHVVAEVVVEFWSNRVPVVRKFFLAYKAKLGAHRIGKALSGKTFLGGPEAAALRYSVA